MKVPYMDSVRYVILILHIRRLFSRAVPNQSRVCSVVTDTHLWWWATKCKTTGHSCYKKTNKFMDELMIVSIIVCLILIFHFWQRSWSSACPGESVRCWELRRLCHDFLDAVSESKENRSLLRTACVQTHWCCVETEMATCLLCPDSCIDLSCDTRTDYGCRSLGWKYKGKDADAWSDRMLLLILVDPERCRSRSRSLVLTILLHCSCSIQNDRLLFQ